MEIVSIPHRYAENSLFIYSFPFTCLVSIPHRYAENKLEYEIEKAVFLGFQSLIGMLKTMFIPTGFLSELKFQSLIGMLKTYLDYS